MYFRAIKGEEFDVNAKANFNELPPLFFFSIWMEEKKKRGGGKGAPSSWQNLLPTYTLTPKLKMSFNTQ